MSQMARVGVRVTRWLALTALMVFGAGMSASAQTISINGVAAPNPVTVVAGTAVPLSVNDGPGTVTTLTLAPSVIAMLVTEQLGMSLTNEFGAGNVERDLGLKWGIHGHALGSGSRRDRDCFFDLVDSGEG